MASGTVPTTRAAIDVARSRPWTRDDLADLPAGFRYEILDGRLLVSPMPQRRHQLALSRIHEQLVGQLDPGLEVLWNVDIDLFPGTLRIPDLVVLDTGGLDLTRAKAEDPARVRLAVEVVSPSSLVDDRIRKPAEYAAAGIPYYWRVELAPFGISVGTLRGGTYDVSQLARDVDTPYTLRGEGIAAA